MVDVGAIRKAVRRQAARVTPGIDDMAAYLAAQVADESHRDVLGPLRPGRGASGVVVHRGETIATWGDPTEPEMCFSASKTALSAVAGLAFDRGMLDIYVPVAATVRHPALNGRPTTWHDLLQQTSGWVGELWGKPSTVDAQCVESESGWAYNDVRVNVLALALTLLWRRPLPDVLRTELLAPLGAPDDWSWHGYPEAVVTIDGTAVPVVSGGAHWGGGLWASAEVLGHFGRAYLDRALLSPAWVAASWRPCRANPNYGYLWWRNDGSRVFPAAPTTGRCARGNGGRHLVWVDPARDLVVASHWGDDPGLLLAEVSAAVDR